MERDTASWQIVMRVPDAVAQDLPPVSELAAELVRPLRFQRSMLVEPVAEGYEPRPATPRCRPRFRVNDRRLWSF